MEITRRKFLASAASAFGLLVVGELPDFPTGEAKSPVAQAKYTWKPMVITVGGLPFDMIAHDYIEEDGPCEIEAHVRMVSKDVAKYYEMCSSGGMVDVEVDTRQRVKISGSGKVKSVCVYNVGDQNENTEKLEITLLMSEQMEVEMLWR